MTPLGLAWRSLFRQPARAWLGIAGVVAVGALLFDMLSLSRGLVLSFHDLLDSIGFDVRVTATSTLPTYGPPLEDAVAVADAVRGLPEVRDVVPICFGRADVVLSGEDSLRVSLIGSGPADRTWTVVEGENLDWKRGERAGSVVVNRNLARRSGLSPGATMTLRGAAPGIDALPAVGFEVSGIAEFAFDTSDEMTAVVTVPDFHSVFGTTRTEAADLLLVASRPGVGSEETVEAIRRARPDVHVFSNDQFVRRFRNTDFSYFRQISFVLSSITLFFAFLLVTTLLTVSVNQRFAEIAGLRAIGFSRRRIFTDLLCESALLVGIGGLLALPVGVVLAGRLDAILRAFPGLPERLHFFVLEPRAVLLHVVLLSATGLLASVYPVFLAMRLPIADTLRKEVVS